MKPLSTLDFLKRHWQDKNLVVMLLVAEARTPRVAWVSEQTGLTMEEILSLECVIGPRSFLRLIDTQHGACLAVQGPDTGRKLLGLVEHVLRLSENGDQFLLTDLEKATIALQMYHASLRGKDANAAKLRIAVEVGRANGYSRVLWRWQVPWIEPYKDEVLSWPVFRKEWGTGYFLLRTHAKAADRRGPAWNTAREMRRAGLRCGVAWVDGQGEWRHIDL